MIHHPYGASSSYMYASVNDEYGSTSFSVNSRDPAPQHLQSFVPRFSTETLLYLSQNGTSDDMGRSAGTKHLYSSDEDSVYPPTSLPRRIWRTLKEFGGSARRRWPLRRFSFHTFVRPCHYQLPNNDSAFFS